MSSSIYTPNSISSLFIVYIFLTHYLILISPLDFMSINIEHPQKCSLSNESNNPEIEAFVNYLKSSSYYPISMIAINAIISVGIDRKFTKLQHIIDDISIYSNSFISSIKSTTNVNTSCNNNQSAIYTHMVSMNCSEMIIEVMIHAECYPFVETQFYLIFMLFSRYTFASFTMTQRITIYTYIHDQV